MALSELPWRAIFEGGIWRVVGPDGVVADLGSDQGDDAVLMASAPELLARVERMRDVLVGLAGIAGIASIARWSCDYTARAEAAEAPGKTPEDFDEEDEEDEVSGRGP